ncbi:MAG TPA: hypothetical protein VMV77_05585 [Bacteroidales bacterium]|nr:hypothetical protein [Bacteroidales bacterium]
MYKQKSEIIEQIQSFHSKVRKLYHTLYEKEADDNVKILLHDLCLHEKQREEYLEKHRKIAKVMDYCVLYPTNRISNKISECFKHLNTRSPLSVYDVAQIESHFDNCLVKFYEILSGEETRCGNIMNTFHYMIKKTHQDETKLDEMLTNSISRKHSKIIM